MVTLEITDILQTFKVTVDVIFIKKSQIDDRKENNDKSILYAVEATTIYKTKKTSSCVKSRQFAFHFPSYHP